MEKLTFTMENYLEAIFELTRGGMGARLTDIAERMSVTKASANSAMAALADRGLVINEKYQEIFLTEKGRALAQSTSKKHRILAKFLTDVLKIDEETADKDACAMEHVISDTSIKALEAFYQVQVDKNQA